MDPDILLPLRNAGVPIMEGAECATATFRNLAEYFEFQQKRRSSAKKQIPAITPHAKLPPGLMAAEPAFRLFETFGIPTAPPGSRTAPTKPRPRRRRWDFRSCSKSNRRKSPIRAMLAELSSS